MSKLRIGTCSWKYPSWEGLVYSAPKGINYLAEYGQKYETVEVDQWFWSLFAGDMAKLPSAKDVQDYRDAVVDPFRFGIKAPNSLTLTHHYSRNKNEPLAANPHFLSPELWCSFTERIGPLLELCGPVMLQFEYLNKNKMANQNAWQDQLGGFLSNIEHAGTIAIETRNAGYYNNGFFDFLDATGTVPVLLQGYWMPPIVELYGKWRERLRSYKTIVIRLHGGDRKEIEEKTGKKWNNIVNPMDPELEMVAEMVKDLLSGDCEVYLYINNHYEGSAPLTIRKLQNLLGE
jgi:uncharacterized protein YecE (DUF72 family)